MENKAAIELKKHLETVLYLLCNICVNNAIIPQLSQKTCTEENTDGWQRP